MKFPVSRLAKVASLAVVGCVLVTGALRGQLPDARAEGWQSEDFADHAAAGLERLGEALKSGEFGTEYDGSRAGLLRPSNFDEQSVEGGFTVRRWSKLETKVGSLTEALNPLRAAFGATGPERVKFKLFGVDGMTTQQYVSLSGPTRFGFLDINATWKIRWEMRDETPEIDVIELQAYEEVARAGTRGRLFVDATDQVLPRDVGVRRQYLHGTDYWRQRIEVFNRMFKFAYSGLAVGDVNGDGLDDLFSCQNGGLPNRLFLQSPDGTLRDATAESGLGILDATQAALLLDLDNDGDQDLVATTPSAVVFFENDGGGVFAARLRSSVAQNGYSLAAADYDGNGFLDIYVCRYQADRTEGAQLAVPVPYFDAQNGGGNYLIRNCGRDKDDAGAWLVFDDATAEVGLDANNSRFSFAATWDDLDGDGDLDLYVANDFGRNVCYLNTLVPDGVAGFREAAVDLGLDDGGFGMSVATADFDRDGRRDLYVGNMFSAAGNRITRQPKFRPDDPDTVVEKFRRMARGNSLYLGGAEKFADVSVASGTTVGRWSWSSVAADVNNDGWEDLLVANGYVTGRAPDDL